MFPGFAATFRRMLKNIELHDYTATGDLAAVVADAEPMSLAAAMSETT